MSTTPSSLDGLLAEHLAERRLTRQSGALQGMLISANDTKVLLQNLEAELKYPLLGDGGLGQLARGPISDALSDQLKRQTTAVKTGQQTPVDTAPQRRARQPVPQRPIAGAGHRAAQDELGPGTEKPVRKAATVTRQSGSGGLSAAQDETESPPRGPAGSRAEGPGHESSRAKVSTTGEHRAVSPIKSRHKSLHAIPQSPSGADEKRGDEKHGHKQAAGSVKNRSKSPSSVPATTEIDARQARNRLTQHMTGAGLINAWESPVAPASPHQAESPDFEQPAEKQGEPTAIPEMKRHRSTQDELPGDPYQPFESPGPLPIDSGSTGVETPGGVFMEQQIELSLKKLSLQKKGQARETQRHAQQGPVVSSSHTVQLSPQHETEAPVSAGGLRGLAARAVGPTGQTPAVRSAGPESFVESGPQNQRQSAMTDVKAAGRSGDSLSELTELLVEEARRAGIDLEKFQP